MRMGGVTKAAFDELSSAVKSQTDRFDRLLDRLDKQDRPKESSRERYEDREYNSESEYSDSEEEGEILDPSIVVNVDEVGKTSGPGPHGDGTGSGPTLPTTGGARLASLGSRYTAKEVCGDPLGPELSDMLATMCVTKMSKSVRKDALEKFHRPSDCAILAVPRINPEIWDTLREPIRSRDTKYQAIQNSVIKGMIAVGRIASSLATAEQASPGPGSDPNVNNNNGDLIETAVDALALLADANLELSYRRRQLIKGEVNADYEALCHKSVPITTSLFGDDVTQQVTKITEANKLGKKVGGAHNQTRKRRHDSRPHPYVPHGGGAQGYSGSSDTSGYYKGTYQPKDNRFLQGRPPRGGNWNRTPDRQQQSGGGDGGKPWKHHGTGKKTNYNK
jgi:hypothetical protein